MTRLIACGVCSDSMLQSAFPAASMWIVVGLSWFAALVIVKAIAGHPRRYLPPWWACLLLAIPTIFAAAWMGFSIMFLPLLILSSLATHNTLFKNPEPAHRVKIVVAWLSGLAVAALTITAVIGFTRSPGQRLIRNWNGPGTFDDARRVAQSSDRPSRDFRAVLDARPKNLIVADAVARYLRCSDGDLECAEVLLTAYEGIGEESRYVSMGEMHERLRSVTGLELLGDASFDEWRIAIEELRRNGL